MSLPETLPAALLETILTGLSALFIAGANGDAAAARYAATQMLAAYNPRTENDLRLAANIVSFSFHALKALGQAAEPDLPLTRILRLRGSAVSLSRESAKAERRLTQSQAARQNANPTQPAPFQPEAAEIHPEAAEIQPKIENAIALIQATGKIADAAKINGLTWSQAYDQRQREIRIAASTNRIKTRIRDQPIAAPSASIPNQHNGQTRPASPPAAGRTSIAEKTTAASPSRAESMASAGR